MTKRMILYTAVFALTVYLSLLYDGSAMRFLIAFEIVLPIIMAAMLLLQRMCVEVAAEIPAASISKGEDIVIELKIKQNIILIQRLFPVHGITVKGKCTDINNSVKPIKKYFDLHYDENGQYSIVFADMTKHYGVVGISIDKIKIYDYMKLFAFKIPFKYENEVYIFPQSSSSAMDLGGLKTDDDEGVGDMIASSFDKSRENVIDLREYRQGDHIKSIHWKLSARMDELMVKEYDELISAKILLFIDGTNTDDRDHWIEQIFFICRSLGQELMEYDIGWLCGGKHIKYTINKTDGFMSAMRMFLKAQQSNGIESTKSGRNKAYSAANLWGKEYSTVLNVDIKGRIHVNGGIYE